MSTPIVYAADLVQEIGTWTPAANEFFSYDYDIAYYELWDSNWTGASIWANNSFQESETTVTVADLSGVYFGGASDFTSEVMWFRATDTQGNTSEWDTFTIDQIADDFTAPTLTTYSGEQTQGFSTQAWWFISANDASGIRGYELWDSSAGGARIWADSAWQPAQTIIETESLTNVWFGGAEDGASETFYVRAWDSAYNLSDWASFTVDQWPVSGLAAAQDAVLV